MTLVPERFAVAAAPARLTPPGPGEPPRLCLVDTAANAAAAVHMAPGLLSREERERATGFHFDRDRTSYVTAHVALRLMLAAYLGTRPGSVPLIRETCPSCGGPHGRPAVEGGAPHFSLSHSRQVTLLAFAATPVGVDVEALPGEEAVDGVWQSLHPAEVAELGTLPPVERREAFARAWARKEAYLKGLGTGLARDLSEDYVGSGPDPAPGPEGWRLTDVAVGDAHRAAVAVRLR
ncbi:4'-phosphopantetheinyl transferase superfamily protein [Streptomyces sp. NPDC026673]|uniref:4'-phosphopantetheinyl transferase family protein n=1 Tax=Streptomyces sp. NPDC026673 TaxID=3155724 RepID=UPI0033E4E4FB